MADHAGYMSNYFRWFGRPEDPFGWFYNLLALMTHCQRRQHLDATARPDLRAGLLAAAVA